MTGMERQGGGGGDGGRGGMLTESGERSDRLPSISAAGSETYLLWRFASRWFSGPSYISFFVRGKKFGIERVGSAGSSVAASV